MEKSKYKDLQSKSNVTAKADADRDLALNLDLDLTYISRPKKLWLISRQSIKKSWNRHYLR